MTENDLPSVIGIQPNMGNAQFIESLLKSSQTKKAAIVQWLAKNGIPVEIAVRAKPETQAKGYASERYLNAWRTNLKTVNVAPPPVLDLDFLDQPKAETKPQSEAEFNAAVMDTVIKTVTQLAETKVNEKIAKTPLVISENVKEQIKSLARQAAVDEIALRAKPQVIEVFNPQTGKNTNIGFQHEKFPLLLRACTARDHKGNRLNVWLTGPTGSGKTSACENVAKALDLPFASDGSLDADYKVVGFLNANGNFINTEFLRIYEGGGIYVADEIDNWSPSALLALNAALANGWISTPKGIIKRHSDACVIACANTWGLGATNDYVGRAKQDAASLDRFQPKIDWPIDERLEAAVAEAAGGTLGLNWQKAIVSARGRVKQNGLKIIISPRATFSGIALLKQGFTPSEVIDFTFAAGLSREQKSALQTDMLANSLSLSLNAA